MTNRTTLGWLAAALVAAAGVGLASCETQGPFEEAGEEIDEAVEDAEDFIENRRD